MSVARLEAVSTRVDTVIERIIALEARADASEADAVACKYEAARLIAEELDRRQCSLRVLGAEIGKSHEHVRRMEYVHRKHGHKAHVGTLAGFNRLYHKTDAKATNWPKPLPSVRIRTAAGMIQEIHVVIKATVNLTQDPERVARAVIKALGEDVIRRVLEKGRA